MFDHLEITVLPQGPRFPAQVRCWVNGADLVEEVIGGSGPYAGRGPYASDALPAGSPSPLRATGAARRLELGQPDCTGGCCGFLTVVVQRFGEVVQWSDWEVPSESPLAPAPSPPPEFHFDASQYNAEVARAEAAGWWQVHP
ncbi:hypothetical protein AB0C77_07345 [Streptomyces sp. NPDC048629]|uniref:hypothetical protein n=1 Tax=Streptomyces sp. NPDC048629 TaxID=3154824 RepID=UPI0034219C10